MREPNRLIGVALLSLSLLGLAEGRDEAALPDAQELAALRSEIAALEAEIQRVRGERSGLAGELERLELELRLQRRRTSEAETAGRLAAAKAEAAAADLSTLEGRLQGVQQALRGRLANLYRLGRGGYLRLLLAVESSTDMMAAVRQMRYLARRDGAAIEDYEAMRADLATVSAELETQRGEVVSWQQREEARRRELESLRRQQRELLEANEAERVRLASQAVALADRERRLAVLVDDLYGESEAPQSGASQSGASQSGAPLSGAPLASFKGVLEWPLDGRVEIRFGTRLDPRYGTRVPHNGIELVTEPEREVAAIYPGKVLYAAPFSGYGPTVVLLHPGRTFSLYAGLDRLAVEEGAILALGQTLGWSSDRLYFEIRIENQPEDPLDWLRASGGG